MVRVFSVEERALYWKAMQVKREERLRSNLDCCLNGTLHRRMDKYERAKRLELERVRLVGENAFKQLCWDNVQVNSLFGSKASFNTWWGIHRKQFNNQKELIELRKGKVVK